MVWGGAVDLAAADDKLIKLRHPLSIDPSGMLLASIMAKKKAAGATHVLIDIPWGKGSKFEKKSEAKKLKKNFLKIGKLLNLKIRVILTDGSQPIGNGIGPALEINDIISVLKGDGPADLRKKAIFMSTEILKLIKVKSPRKKVIEVIENGQAYAKFKEIIYAQGGRKHFKVPRAKYFHNINAKRDGKVKEINSKTIAKISRLAGAPEDKTAGIYLRVKLNSKVKKSTTLYTIYSNSEQDLETVKKRLKALNPISY